MADYSSAYQSEGIEITIKFRLKADKGTPFSEDVFRYLFLKDSKIGYLAEAYSISNLLEVVETKKVRY